MKNFLTILLASALACSCCSGKFIVSEGEGSHSLKGSFSSFTLSGEYLPSSDAEAVLRFAVSRDLDPGYEVVFHDGGIDGTIKTGSLHHVRNLYRSLAPEDGWCPFQVRVAGKNIQVDVNGKTVVNYTEPEEPYRTAPGMILGEGSVSFEAVKGRMSFRKVRIVGAGDVPTQDASAPVDEKTDLAIRFQQEDYPIIDYHVHLKGGLTAEMADRKQLSYGINYGVAPNAGEGGVGEMLASDDEVYEYYDKVKDLTFLRGVQGEGRRWTGVFSKEALGVFDYLFTDAMTIVDHKGRLARLYRPEEVIFDGIDKEGYMERIVDQTVRILANEPADIYANATYIPECMSGNYDELWTDERIDRVLNVMKDNNIALEISARYRIPSERIILKAKQKGLKFTFGTNNADADFGRLEYSLEMARRCGITKDDIWFPVMSTRSSRPVVIYNVFSAEGSRITLFNGKDLDGWKAVADTSDLPAGLFCVRGGSIAVDGQPFGFIRTTRKYSDYKLHVEWRWVGEGTNSGIFQRVDDSDKVWPEAVECQLKAGCAGDLVCLGGARIAELPYDPAVKFPKKIRNHPGAAVELPDGEWNRAEIICKGQEMLVYINGNFENKATLQRTEGYIALQSEGGPVEFRNIYIEPVE